MELLAAHVPPRRYCLLYLITKFRSPLFSWNKTTSDKR
jgi:hypothetical protein